MNATSKAHRHPHGDRRQWGRWGAEDERGAPNLLTADRVLAAAALVRRGEVLSLAVPLERGTPLPAHRPSPAHFMARDGGDYPSGGDGPGRSRFSDDTMLVALHTGTHVDALAHVWYGDELYNGFPQSSIRSGSGAARCGIDKLGPLVGRGVLLDVAAGAALPDDARITAADLDRCARCHRVELREGDIVLVRTGWWSTHAHAPTQRFRAEPGPDLDGARWLAANGAAVVGADNFAFEALGGGDRSFPVHELLLRDRGIPIVEGLALDELARRAVYEFLFMLAPLPITGGTASPANPLAVI
jgi:kynurenine formamidase